MWLERVGHEVLGMAPSYWLSKERRFLDDLGLVIAEDLKANIEYVERLSHMFGVPPYVVTPAPRPKKGP
jgi:hypothetical protein